MTPNGYEMVRGFFPDILVAPVERIYVHQGATGDSRREILSGGLTNNRPIAVQYFAHGTDSGYAGTGNEDNYWTMSSLASFVRCRLNPCDFSSNVYPFALDDCSISFVLNLALDNLH